MTETQIAPPDAQRCLAALREQRDCYQHLEALSREQKQFVDGGDSGKLLDVLARRQTWADAAVAVDRKLQPLKAGWPESARLWSEADRAAARALFAEIKTLLEALTTRDVGDMLSLQRQKHGVGRELGRAQADDRSVRSVHRRYAAAAYGAASLTDVRK